MIGGVGVKINQVKFGAVMSYVSYGLSVILNLVMTPLMIKSFGENEYGVYSLVLPVVSMMTVLTFGLGSVYTRYYSIYKTKNDKDRMARLNGMFISIYTGIGVVAIILGFGLSLVFEWVFPKVTPEYVPLAKTLLRLASVNMALSFPIYVFTSHIVVNEAYVFQKTLAAIKMILNPVLTVPLLLLGYRSVAVMILTVLLTLASGVADVIYCFKRLKMPVSFGRFEKGLLGEMLRFTSFVFLSNVVDEINWNSDRIVLGIFQGEEVVGLYDLGAKINIYFMSLATMLTNVFVPRAHRLVASGKPDRDISDLFIKVGRLQFMLMSVILIGFIAIGRGFMSFYSGGQYDATEVYILALLLMIPTVVPSIQNLGIEIQQAKNKHRFRAVTYAIVAVVNVILSIPLCLYFGAVGAALGTTFTVVVGKGVLMNWYYQKHVHLDIGRFWKEIAKIGLPMLPPLVIAILMAVFVDTSRLSSFIACGAVIVAIEAVCMWCFGMNKDDREQIAGPLLRRLKR